MRPTLVIIIQIVLAGFVLMAVIFGIEGAVGMTERLFGIDLRTPGVELGLIELSVGILMVSIGVSLTGIGFIAILLLLVFKYPALGAPMFGRKTGGLESKLYNLFGKYGQNLKEYAARETSRIKVVDDSNNDI